MGFVWNSFGKSISLKAAFRCVFSFLLLVRGLKVLDLLNPFAVFKMGPRGTVRPRDNGVYFNVRVQNFIRLLVKKRKKHEKSGAKLEAFGETTIKEPSSPEGQQPLQPLMFTSSCDMGASTHR